MQRELSPTRMLEISFIIITFYQGVDKTDKEAMQVKSREGVHKSNSSVGTEEAGIAPLNKALKGQCFLEALPSTRCPVDMMKYSQITVHGSLQLKKILCLCVCDLTFIDYRLSEGGESPANEIINLVWSCQGKLQVSPVPMSETDLLC